MTCLCINFERGLLQIEGAFDMAIGSLLGYSDRLFSVMLDLSSSLLNPGYPPPSLKQRFHPNIINLMDLGG